MPATMSQNNKYVSFAFSPVGKIPIILIKCCYVSAGRDRRGKGTNNGVERVEEDCKVLC